MAELGIQVVLGRLVEFLEKETLSIYGIRDEVKTIEGELRGIKCFLKDADSRRGKDERIKNWVDDLCQMAYEIEDVMDTFLAETGSYYNQKDLKGKAKRYAHTPKTMIDRLKIGSKIAKIKNKIDGIDVRRERLGIQGIDGGADPRRQTLLGRRKENACEENQPNDDVVGMEEKIKLLVKRLDEGETSLCVISVVGQAGLGKTVLARNVFNLTKSSFRYSVWIHVSSNNPNEVLRELCKAVQPVPGHDIEKLNEGEMQEKIADELKGKTYLVVLDDVRTTQTWDVIRGALPGGNGRCRVLMTTQNEGVAKHADTLTPPYRLPSLNQKESHELLCRHAFPEQPHSCPLELEELANHIVKRCGGLPLALVAAGGILSGGKPTVRAWEDFVDGFGWHLTQGSAEISTFLGLSFDDLRSDLKPCLLYCCAFPRDSEVRVKRLLRLWIAEGFVERQGERQPEAIAMRYLEELVDRNLIQPCKCDLFGEIKSCRVHDVLREMLAAAAREQNFFQIHPTRNNYDPSNCRRLVTHHRLEQKTRPLRSARSFISFAESEGLILYDQIQNFKLLRVLDLEGVRSVELLPIEIGELVLLRYLGLRHTSIKTLPSSIKKLCNLQTLDLRTSSVLSQSNVSLNLKGKHVKKMTKLRHLYFGNSRGKVFNAMEVPEDFGVKNPFKELQTLSYVKAGGWVEKGLCTMPNLRKLGMQITDGNRTGSTFRAIAKLSCIYSLYLQGELADLHIDAFVKLTKLTFDSSSLSDDPFSGLQTLQFLKSLRLVNNAYNGKTMRCTDGGFLSLQVLNLEKLEHLEDIFVDSGGFPQLKYMRIAVCKNLNKIPHGLENVVSLQELKLIDMGACLVERVQPDMGEDWHRVKHIQPVIITTSAAESKMDVNQLN